MHRSDLCSAVHEAATQSSLHAHRQQTEKVWRFCTADCYSASKKGAITPFAATWMDLESVVLSEDSRGGMSCDIPYMWNLKSNDTNELTKQKRLTDLENELMVAVG